LLIVLLVSLSLTAAPTQEETAPHEHPDPNLQHIKGLEYYDDFTEPSDAFWDSELFKQISTKLGFDKKAQLESTDLKSFLFHLAGYEGHVNDTQIPQGLKEIYENYLKNFTDKIETPQLRNKLNITDLFNSVKDYYYKINQPTYYERVVGMFAKTWGNVKGMFKHMFHKEEKHPFWDAFNTIQEKLGIKDMFTKKDIMNILKRMLIKDKDSKMQMPKAVQDIFDRLMENIPDTISFSDLNKYINYDVIMDVLRNVTQAHYGDEYQVKFKDLFASGNVQEILSKVFNFTMSQIEL